MIKLTPLCAGTAFVSVLTTTTIASAICPFEMNIFDVDDVVVTLAGGRWSEPLRGRARPRSVIAIARIVSR